MALISGASQFLNQAILSAKVGSTFSAPDILTQSGGADLLSIGRRISSSRIGISSRARLLNESFLNNSAGTANQLFSLSGGASATTEAAITQIAGLRATTVASRVIPELREDSDGISESTLGTTVDESV